MAAIRRLGLGAGRLIAYLVPGVLAALLPLTGCMARPAGVSDGAVAPGTKVSLLLTQTIQGGWLASRIDAHGMTDANSLKNFKPLLFPSALAVFANDLYIADAGANRIYRYDKELQALVPVPKISANTATRLQAGSDRSLYILDPARSVIVQIARGGQILQTLNPTLATSRFNEFIVDDVLGRIYASDQLNQQIAMLHPMGETGVPLTWQQSGQVRILGAIAASRQALYAIDEGNASIVRLTHEGVFQGRFGQKDLTQPRALMVDRFERVYVIDRFDRTLKLFQGGLLAAQFEAGKLGLTEITALALERDLLYVADGPGAKVMIFRVMPAIQDGLR